MSFVRAGLMSAFVLALAISPFLANAVSATTTRSPDSARQTLVAAANSNNGNSENDNVDNINDNVDNTNDNVDNTNDNVDNFNDNGGNSNGSNDNNGNGGNGNGNGNGHGHGGNGNGNGNGNKSQETAASTSGAGGSGTCASAGHDTLITSADAHAAIHVYPTMPRNIRITLVTPVDPTTLPAIPGTKVDGLLYQVTADDCSGGAISPFPVEVNLGMHYADLDATGLTETKFVIAHLDPVDNTWKQELKQAADPVNNFVSATIVNTGYFVVYQTP